jgi:hypothetical protein
MMIVEGRGCVAPAVVPIRMDDGSLRTLLAASRHRDQFRGYRHKAGEWERGLAPAVVIPGVGTIDQSVRAIMSGLVGEYATAWYLNSRVDGCPAAIDYALRSGGDGGTDLKVVGIDLQIKNTTKADHPNMVRVVSARGKHLPLTADAFVFSHWEFGRTVFLRGWCKTSVVNCSPLADAIRGSHKNREVPCEHLDTMSSLCDYLNARRLAGCR